MMSSTLASAHLPAHDTPMATLMLKLRQTLPFRNSMLMFDATMRAQKRNTKCFSGPVAHQQTHLSDGMQLNSFASRTNSNRNSFGVAKDTYFSARKFNQKHRRACFNKTARTTTRYYETSEQAAFEKLTEAYGDQSAGKLSPLSNVRGAVRMGMPAEPQDCEGLRSAHSSRISKFSHQSRDTTSSQAADRELDLFEQTKASQDMPRNVLPAEGVQQTLGNNDSNSRCSDETDHNARSSNNRILHASRGRLLRRRAALVGAAGAAAWTDALRRCCGSCAQAVEPARAAAAAPASATAPTSAAAEWTYGDSACLASSWGGICSSGQRQSPIDIAVRRPKKATLSVVDDGGSASASSPPLELGGVLNFDYSVGAPSVLNTGHRTIQVSFKNAKNTLKVGDNSFQLLQFHFHAPSEHAVNGERYAMEAHLVHQDPSTGKLAVVGVMLEASEPALPNECLAAGLAYVPREHGASVDAPILLSPSSLLPPAFNTKNSRSYVHYSGSLTTPPCSEDVNWFVLDTPVRIAKSQVLDFMFFAGDGYSLALNARPLQPAGNRQITTGP